MTWIFNQPSDFKNEMVAGFVSAHKSMVRQVPGGVVRNTQSKPGSVAVVIGGGSGHYPAFAGLVGQGLAHGAAMGNLFASPSAQQICSVARAAHNGGGVLLTFGNYAGDVLHFGLACERLRAEGIPCETLAITDDVSSAPLAEKEKRRGVAGDLVVFKIAAAAAERGDSLAEVLAIARRANEHTRTLGLAFGGCTLPGAQDPLFTVPEGKIGFGLGIHGEPGIHELPLTTSEALARLLTDGLLQERPQATGASKGARLGVIINGLGAVKYEELFVFWHNVEALLSAADVVVADVQIGEFVTSFNMAGMSMTFVWFDDELESLWLAPAVTPAFTRGSVLAQLPLDAVQLEQNSVVPVPQGSPASQQAAARVMKMIDAIAQTVINNADELGRIDAIAGDGDHGIGMTRGVTAARQAAQAALAQGGGVGTLLQMAADGWSDEGGGTSGAIWGVILNTLGTALGNSATPDAVAVAAAIEQANDGVMHFGKARPGDKTLVDVLLPFSQALRAAADAGLSLSAAWQQAARVARQSADSTAQLLPKIGRARPLAERSLGTPDAGALSLAMIITAVAEVMAGGDVAAGTQEKICPQK
ncbi:dihydroxyacetone kinase family protein [[Erwinia] mediterraneensis]|uniref:dihydroxyacetone kinase family protein n=1 Tax=[Erwinia] mediterraneensis TaxID=2161819 RepID=UPI00102FCFFA|nr:dihydroxyacetone kinase family protein [[Erwinia] mediterraneensis]